jgi:hypothetical protein
MNQIENGMRRTVMGVAAAFSATAKLEFPDIFAPLVNNPAETEALLLPPRTLHTCSRLALGRLLLLAMPVAWAAVRSTTRVTTSTTRHCRSEQAYSRA